MFRVLSSSLVLKSHPKLHQSWYLSWASHCLLFREHEHVHFPHRWNKATGSEVPAKYHKLSPSHLSVWKHTRQPQRSSVVWLRCRRQQEKMMAKYPQTVSHLIVGTHCCTPVNSRWRHILHVVWSWQLTVQCTLVEFILLETMKL